MYPEQHPRGSGEYASDPAAQLREAVHPPAAAEYEDQQYGESASLETQEHRQQQQQVQEGDPSSLAPAEYLRQLEARAEALLAQRTSLKAQLGEAARAAYQAVADRLGPASSGIPLPSDPAALVEELMVLQAVRQYLTYLQDLQALARQADKLARAAEREYTAGGDAAGFLQAASDAVDAFSTATGYVMALDQLAADGGVPSTKLVQQGGALSARVAQAGATLRGLLSAAAQQRLAACGWPPPLTASADTDAGPAAGAGWEGFASAGEATVGELQHLFTVMLTLQRATQHAEFAVLGADPGVEGPVLWPAEELARGVADRLHHHFAQGLPTDRADKPEWLFAAALKAARQCAPPGEVFQPAVDAHGLEHWYSMQLEGVRALHSVGVAPLLRSHVLPRLAATADAAAWLHYADEAARYERQLAPLRGVATGASVADQEEDGTTVACPGSAIEVLFEEEAWRQGWLQAELSDAQRQLEAACDAPDAWLPQASRALESLDVALDGSSGLGPSAGAAAAPRAASQEEFWPPACADVAVALVTETVRRCGWVAAAAHRQQFYKAVTQPVVKTFRARLSSVLQTAEQFKGMLEDAWLPKVGAAICAAHYAEHSLREPQGALLAASAVDAAAEGGSPLAVLLEREAAALSTLRRQWAYKLAKLAVDQFQGLFAAYRRDFSVFAAGFDADAPPGQQQQQPDQLSPPAGPSARLLPAAHGLQRLLEELSHHLDAVIFRDVWRAAALAVNYAMFNDVATEAAFSAQGALQAAADCDALVAVFVRCTSRPAAHFKESKEACKLLLMPSSEATQLLSTLVHEARGAGEVLVAHGVRALNAEQAASVLARRLDLQGASA